MYRDTIHSVNHLSNEEAGKLFKHVLEYVNDLNPQTDDKVVLLSFEPIKQYLKRDLKKYEQIVSKRSAAGKASVQSRLQKKKNAHEAKSTPVETVEKDLTNSTVIDSDSVSVSVSVNDIVIDINKKGFSSDEVFQTFDRVVEYFEDKFLPKTTAAVIKWLKEIDKLHRIDGHDFQMIEKVVKWAKQDDFWSTNFFTMLKMRKTNPEGVKYFDVFLHKMNGSKKSVDNFTIKDAKTAEEFFKK